MRQLGSSVSSGGGVLAIVKPFINQTSLWPVDVLCQIRSGSPSAFRSPTAARSHAEHGFSVRTGRLDVVVKLGPYQTSLAHVDTVCDTRSRRPSPLKSAVS